MSATTHCTYYSYKDHHKAVAEHLVNDINAWEKQGEFLVMTYVISSIIHSCCYFEAYINELIEEYSNPKLNLIILNNPYISSLKIKLNEKNFDRKTTLEKYEIFSELQKEKLFNKSNHIYGDLKSITKLRNYFVHAKYEGVYLNKEHDFDILKTKFKANKHYEYSIKSWFPEKCLGAGCATWVYETIDNFINEYEKNFNKLKG